MSIPFPQIQRRQATAETRRCEHCGRLASTTALSCVGCGSGRLATNKPDAEVEKQEAGKRPCKAK